MKPKAREKASREDQVSERTLERAKVSMGGPRAQMSSRCSAAEDTMGVLESYTMAKEIGYLPTTDLNVHES